MNSINSIITSKLNIINNDIKLISPKTQLLAVTKNTSLENIQILYDLGVRNFGENRVTQLMERSEFFKHKGLIDINWHMIGKIQSNKINKLKSVYNLKFIHSIDSIKLLEKFKDSEIKLFIQINTSEETEKSGFISIEKLKDLNILSYENIVGLMTMSKLRTDNFVHDAEICFKKLSLFKDHLNKNYLLSMGMSNDYKIALKYKSDFIRVGSFLFSK